MKHQKKLFARRVDISLVDEITSFRRELSRAHQKDYTLDQVSERLLRLGLDRKKECLRKNTI